MHGVAEKVIEFFAILKENAALATALRFCLFYTRKNATNFAKKADYH